MRKWVCWLCMGAGVALSAAACTVEKTDAVQKTSGNPEAESGQPGQEAGEQTTEEAAGEKPAYVYYIKNDALMRLNVRENPEGGSGAEKLFDLPENMITLKDHDGAVYTEDGRLAAFLLDVSDPEDTWNIDELLIAADNQSGDAKELYRGFGTVKAGENALYYLIQEAGTKNDEAVMPVNLYRYTPEQGSEKLAEGVDSFDLLRDGSVVFARLREDGGRELYLAENGKETLLAEGMYYSGSEAQDSSLYVWRDAQEEDRSYKELAVVGRDGSCQEILTGDEEAWSYYIDAEVDGVYYVRGMETPTEENGWNAARALFYKERGGEPVCLAEELQGIWGYEMLEEADSVRNVLLYTAGEPEQTELYGAVQGEAFLLEPEDRQWSYDLAITWTGTADETIDLVFQKWGSDFRIEGGGIYRLRWNKDQLNPPALMAEGCEVAVQRPIGGGNGTLFYSDYPLDGQGGYGDSLSLYCKGQEILADYVSGSLMAAGESGTEYFALSQRKSEEESAPAAADLTRVTSAGSSKVMKEDVALCEPWEGGLLMLADCEKEYPYRGSLCFYDGQEIRTLDDGVTVFFGHGSGTVAEAVPKEWDLYGVLGDLDWQEVPVEDLWWESKGYMEGDTYYSTAEGFTLDLAPFAGEGSFATPEAYHGSCLFYYEDDGNIQAFQLHVSEEEGVGYASAEEYGNHLKEQYEVSLRSMENFGVNTDGLRLVVESAENMELDGREAFRMSYFTGTEEKKLSRILLYAIPDREEDRMILLAGTLYAEDAACEEICTGVAESLRWEE